MYNFRFFETLTDFTGPAYAGGPAPVFIRGPARIWELSKKFVVMFKIILLPVCLFHFCFKPD